MGKLWILNEALLKEFGFLPLHTQRLENNILHRVLIAACGPECPIEQTIMESNMIVMVTVLTLCLCVILERTEPRAFSARTAAAGQTRTRRMHRCESFRPSQAKRHAVEYQFVQQKELQKL